MTYKRILLETEGREISLEEIIFKIKMNLKKFDIKEKT